MKIALQEKLLARDEFAANLDFAEEIGVYSLDMDWRALSDRVHDYDGGLVGRRIRVVSV